ncbi:two-component regulator propeller domain-containing protein, partial [bacterium]
MTNIGRHVKSKLSIWQQSCLLSFVILFQIISAQKIDFEHLTTQDGLSQGSVTSIVQDSIGFMWFGTYDGLNRYDGANIKSFRKDPANPNCLNYNFIRTLFSGEKGLLWIGTSGGGLNLFDSKKERFTHYSHDPDNPYSISHDEIYTIYKAESGTIWIGTWGGGLNKAVSSSMKNQYTSIDSLIFIHYHHDPDNPKSIAHDKITSIYEDQNGNLWIGTREGVSVFDPKKEEVSRNYKHDPQNSNSLSSNNVTTICEDREGYLWIGTWGDGLNKFDPKTNRFVHYSHDPKNSKSISHNTIMSLFNDRSGDLWIGTWGGGLNKLISKKNQDQFIRYKHYSNNPLTIAGNSIYHIFEDHTGVLWIATDWNGISKYNKDNDQFQHYQSDPNVPDRLNDNTIFSLIKDSHNILWIGTRDGGLNAYDQKTDQYMHYMHDPKDPFSISHNMVRYIYEDHEENIWIGSEMGLNLFDRKDQKFYRYFRDINDQGKDHILTIHEDHEGYLWIGNWGDGLLKFDPRTKAFVDYNQVANDSSSLKDQIIWCIVEDKHDRLWIGTDQNGLYLLDKNNSFTHYTHDEQNIKSLSDNKILSIFHSMNGDIWIGTTMGLNQVVYHEDPDTPLIFKHYFIKDGLYSNIIQGINEDNHGMLWLCNGEYLAAFNPEKNQIRGYHIIDRLQAGEFSLNAIFRDDHTGNMYVGSVNGFNIFHPDSITRNTTIPNVAITNFKIFNQSILPEQIFQKRIVLDKSITETNEIILSYKDDVLVFEFAALHFNSPDNNQFAFKMEGFDKAWNEAGNNQRMATYTNLDPGEYTFRVKASNNDGFWNEEGVSLNIVIQPPFWQTWWFRIITFILLGFSIYGF